MRPSSARARLVLNLNFMLHERTLNLHVIIWKSTIPLNRTTDSNTLRLFSYNGVTFTELLKRLHDARLIILSKLQKMVRHLVCTNKNMFFVCVTLIIRQLAWFEWFTLLEKKNDMISFDTNCKIIIVIAFVASQTPRHSKTKKAFLFFCFRYDASSCYFKKNRSYGMRKSSFYREVMEPT